jgi:hypothetical protein
MIEPKRFQTRLRGDLQLLQVCHIKPCSVRWPSGYRRARLHRLLPQSSSSSRFTAGAFGFLTFTNAASDLSDRASQAASHNRAAKPRDAGGFTTLGVTSQA